MFLLRYFLLLHLFCKYQFLVEATPNEIITDVADRQQGLEDCPTLSDRMLKIEDKSEKQEKEMKIMKNTIATDKNRINELTSRVSQLESSLAKAKTIEKIFGRPKRPVRLLPPHLFR